MSWEGQGTVVVAWEIGHESSQVQVGKDGASLCRGQPSLGPQKVRLTITPHPPQPFLLEGWLNLGEEELAVPFRPRAESRLFRLGVSLGHGGPFTPVPSPLHPQEAAYWCARDQEALQGFRGCRWWRRSVGPHIRDFSV